MNIGHIWTTCGMKALYINNMVLKSIGTSYEVVRKLVDAIICICACYKVEG